MSKYDQQELSEEVRRLESERLQMARELHTASAGPHAIFMSAQILRHRISLALLRARLGTSET